MTEKEIYEIIELTYKISQGKPSCANFPTLNKEDRKKFQILSEMQVFDKELNRYIEENDNERWKYYIKSTNTHHRTINNKEITEKCVSYFLKKVGELEQLIDLPLVNFQDD